jgi:hypothetical protein
MDIDYEEAVDRFDYTKFKWWVRLILLPIVLVSLLVFWVLAVIVLVPYHVANSALTVIWLNYQIVKRNLR